VKPGLSELLKNVLVRTGASAKKSLVKKAAPKALEMGEGALLRLRVKEARGLEPSELARELVKQGKRREDVKAKPILSAKTRAEAEDAIERHFDEGYDTSDSNRLSALRSTEVGQKVNEYRAIKGADPDPETKKRMRAEWTDKAKEEGRLAFRVLANLDKGKAKELHGGVRALEKEHQQAKQKFLSLQGGGRSPKREEAFQEMMGAGKAVGEEAEKFRNIAYSIMKNSSNPELELDRFLRKYPAAARAIQSRAVNTINKAGLPGEAEAALRARATDPKAGKGARFGARVALGDSLNMRTPKKGLDEGDRKTIAWRLRNKAASLTDGQPGSTVRYPQKDPREGVMGPPVTKDGRTARRDSLMKRYSDENEFVRAVTQKERERSHQVPGLLARKIAGDKGKHPGTFFQPEGMPNPKPYRDKKTGQTYPMLSEQGKSAVKVQKANRGRVGSQRLIADQLRDLDRRSGKRGPAGEALLSKDADQAEKMATALTRVAKRIEQKNPSQKGQVEQLLKMAEGLRGGQEHDPRILEILETLGY